MLNHLTTNCIMLVDDDETTNFLHSIILEDAKITKEVLAYDNGQNALTHLSDLSNNSKTKPDLILLDINMPGMDGWDFIEEFQSLPSNLRDEITVLMLSTSSNPDDIAKAESYNVVKGFLSKPLDTDEMQKVLKKQ